MRGPSWPAFVPEAKIDEASRPHLRSLLRAVVSTGMCCGDAAILNARQSTSHPRTFHVAAQHESGNVVPPDACDQSLYRLVLLARFPPGPAEANGRHGLGFARNIRLCGVQVSTVAEAPVLVSQRCLRDRRLARGPSPPARERGRGGPRLGVRALGDPAQTCRGEPLATDGRLLGVGSRKRDPNLGLFCRSIRTAIADRGGYIETIGKRPGTVPILRSPRSKMGLSPSPQPFSDSFLEAAQVELAQFYECVALNA
jgi:hypothetical protein